MNDEWKKDWSEALDMTVLGGPGNIIGVRADVLQSVNARLVLLEKNREELKNIVNAKRFSRDHFRDDTEYADWLQSRGRAALCGEG